MNKWEDMKESPCVDCPKQLKCVLYCQEWGEWFCREWWRMQRNFGVGHTELERDPSNYILSQNMLYHRGGIYDKEFPTIEAERVYVDGKRNH